MTVRWPPWIVLSDPWKDPLEEVAHPQKLTFPCSQRNEEISIIGADDCVAITWLTGEPSSLNMHMRCRHAELVWKAEVMQRGRNQTGESAVWMNDAVQTYRLISLTSAQHTHLLQHGPAGVMTLNLLFGSKRELLKRLKHRAQWIYVRISARLLTILTCMISLNVLWKWLKKN